MSNSPFLLDLDVKLRRLLKGTLYIAVASVYVAIVALVFLMHGWKAALLSGSLIAVSLILRFVSDEVYRIGQIITKNDDTETSKNGSVRGLQRWLYVLILGLVYLSCVGLIAQTFVLASQTWLVSLVVSLIAVELAFIWIRQVNKQISFRQASYGLPERDPFGFHASRQSQLNIEKDERLDRKIAELESLVNDGKISQLAFEKARDRHRIKNVMERDD